MNSWKSNFAALLVAETLAILGFALSMPVIPLFLEDDIGVKDPRELKLWVGAIQSLASVTLAIFAPIWGHLADVYSRRSMLLRAMFGGAAVISLMTFVREPWQLLALRSIQGCLTGTVAAATVITAGISPAARLAFTLGLLQTGIAVGNALGPLFGGVISDFLGHRIAFLSTSLVLAAAGFIVLTWVEDDKSPSRSTVRPASRSTGNKKISLLPDLSPIVHSPVLTTLMFVSFGIQAANTIAEPMMPLFIKELVFNAQAAAGISESPQYIGSATGLVLGVGAAFTALAAVLVGKYCTGIGYWKTLIFCLVAGAILRIPQALVTTVYQLVIFRALASFFIGGAAPVLNAIIAVSIAKEQQGAVFGVNTSVSSAGGAVGPIIGSSVAMLSYRAVFLATATLLGLCAWTTILRRRKTK
jgi:DHA1 family multidrug resistance protein-like MFS transporter